MAALAVLGVTWLYVHGREAALAVAAAPVALTLGLLIGRTYRGIRTRSLAADWWIGIVVWLALSSFAVACGYVLLNPPSAPTEYDAIFDAVGREGISLTDLILDDTVQFISYQALGTALLIAGALLLLLNVTAILSKQALMAGRRSTRWRRTLAAGARSGTVVAAELLTVSALLGAAFVFGSGYAYSWVDDDAAGQAQIIAPSASLADRALTVDFVVDEPARIQLTVQPRAGRKPLHRSRRALPAGRHRLRRSVPRRVGRVVVTLTAFDARGVVAERRRLTTSRSR